MAAGGEAGRRVLLISQDIIGPAMAGSGLRCLRLAQSLARHAAVRLAVPHESPPGAAIEGASVARYTRRDWPSLAPHAAWAEVIVAPGDLLSDLPELAGSDACLVVDGYDPHVAEWLAITLGLEAEGQQAHWRRRMCDLNRQYLAGDFYICASERQRDWWLGLLEANGRINAWTYRDDASLRRLIDVVPTGVPDEPPRRLRPAIKGVVPGIGAGDRLVLWGGGLWPWLDPVTAVRALARVWRERQDVRLVLPGVEHPNPWMKGIPTHIEAARAAAREAGLLDSGVFFTGWLPYEDWPGVLLESDVALALGHDTLETRLAYRSRVIDYIWAGLPAIATRGDATSELVAGHGLGAVVDAGDVEGVAAALRALLDAPRDSFAAGFERARAALRWERAVGPLVEFCLHPRRAPDRAAGEVGNPYYLAETQRLRGERDELAATRDRLAAERDAVLRENARLAGEVADYAYAGHQLVLARDALIGEREALIGERDAWRARHERLWFVRLRRAGYRLWQRLRS